MVALLHREANQLLHGSYSEKTGKALLSAVARATESAGFMSGDVGRHALAQRYHIQALDLALRAGDRCCAADILQEASRLTVRIGENAPTGLDTLRHGRQAVALARAGLTIAQGTATPALAAKLHAVEGRGFALLGDAARPATLWRRPSAATNRPAPRTRPCSTPSTGSGRISDVSQRYR